MSERELLFQGARFSVERVWQTMPDGTRHAREVVRHPGAVVILPILDDGRVCLVRNYRAAVEQRLLELPAGTLESGEDPADCAHRELAEETGYRSGRMEHLLSFWMSPGILDERMHLYLATQLEPGKMALDAGEDIQTQLLPWNEALDMVRQGRIQDSKTINGILFYDYLVRTRPP
jgi:ADP-ribose pyrophosphatase